MKKLYMIGILYCASLCAQVTWQNAVITANVVDQDVIIKGTNTLGAAVTVIAETVDVTVRVVGAGILKGAGSLQLRRSPGRSLTVCIEQPATLECLESMKLLVGPGVVFKFAHGALVMNGSSEFRLVQ